LRLLKFFSKGQNVKAQRLKMKIEQEEFFKEIYISRRISPNKEEDKE